MNLDNKYHVFAVVNVLVGQLIALVNRDNDEAYKTMASVFANLMSSMLLHLCHGEDPDEVMAKIKAEREKFESNMGDFHAVRRSI